MERFRGLFKDREVQMGVVIFGMLASYGVMQAGASLYFDGHAAEIERSHHAHAESMQEIDQLADIGSAAHDSANESLAEHLIGGSGMAMK